jgi:hypothetical protein
MFLKNIFRQPYLDDDSGTEIGGGADTDNFELDVDTDANTETNTDTDTKPEGTQEQEEKPEDTAEDTKPAEESAKESPKVKLKYNHEEKEYSLEDVVPLAQKGLNYDKLQEKFNEIQNNPALSKYSKVQEISQLLGYQSDDELLDALYNTYYQNTAESQGLTPEQIKKDYELQQKEKQINEKSAAEDKKQKDAQMYADFMANYPDVRPEMIKPETWDKVNKGMDLSAAYAIQEAQDLKNEIKILKQNAENQKKAPIGGVSKNGSDTSKNDAFLDGFDEI